MALGEDDWNEEWNQEKEEMVEADWRATSGTLYRMERHH